MKIDGKAIAERILAELTREVVSLKERGVVPTLAVILVGDNPASLAYIRQKEKAAERIGAKLVLCMQSLELSQNQLHELIEKYNTDPSIHGLIVQRPLPKSFAAESIALCSTILLSKDVDGFLPNSPFTVPVAAAVVTLMEEVFYSVSPARACPAALYGEPETIKRKTWIPGQARDDNFIKWLRSKNIVVIGRGETAGKPIADYISRLFATLHADVAIKSNGFTTSLKERRNNQYCATIRIVHSQTPSPAEIIKQADIAVSCVGKQRVVTKDVIKPGVILIGVGIWRDSEGKLRGDYAEEDIGRIASFYTPTPGGVGPVNVACLMQNLVTAAQNAH